MMNLDSLFRILENGFHNIKEQIAKMDYLHLLLLCALGIGMAIVIFGVIRQAIRKKMEFFWGTLAALCAGLVLFFCLIASSAGTIVFLPDEDPQEVAIRFAQSCMAQDVQQAGGLQLAVIPEGADETEKLIYDALRSSFSVSAAGEMEIEGRHAKQMLSVTYLDLKQLTAPIKAAAEENIAAYIESHTMAEIYDEQDNYRTEFMEDAYKKAVLSTLGEVSKYYTTVEVPLQMTYENGHWQTRPDDQMTMAFSGGITTLDTFANNLKSEALSEIIYIPKRYTIAEDAVLAPAPDAANFGSTADINEINALYASSKLTEGRTLFWDENADFRGKEFRYYADETILVVAWKELYLGKYCAFAEVFIADPSQFRRKLAADTYGSGIQKTASQLARESNAVIAMNGDYYKYRSEGITVYQRELYRFRPHKLECCHVNSAGDLLFTYAGELASEEAARSYIEQNDVLFTLTFGPVLVANGELHPFARDYLLGQGTQNYSRAAIGQSGSCHYLLMNLNYGYGSRGATLSEEALVMHGKGCENAYALDGGQTAEIVIQNKVFNAIDYGNERLVSDIIYFGTALQEEENR